MIVSFSCAKRGECFPLQQRVYGREEKRMVPPPSLMYRGGRKGKLIFCPPPPFSAKRGRGKKFKNCCSSQDGVDGGPIYRPPFFGEKGILIDDVLKSGFCETFFFPHAYYYYF